MTKRLINPILRQTSPLNFIIEFVGKKGVVNKSVVKDKNVCKLIKLLCNKSGNSYIFRYGGDKIHISERHVNNFLKTYDPKIKVKCLEHGMLI